MFKIHELRVSQNFFAFDSICKREKINFFLMLDVVKLLQNSLDYGENFFDVRIEFKRVRNKRLLENVMKNKKSHLLIDLENEAFSVKPETYFLLEEIYNIQKEEDKKALEFNPKSNNFYIWVS